MRNNAISFGKALHLSNLSIIKAQQVDSSHAILLISHEQQVLSIHIKRDGILIELKVIRSGLRNLPRIQITQHNRRLYQVLIHLVFLLLAHVDG